MLKRGDINKGNSLKCPNGNKYSRLRVSYKVCIAAIKKGCLAKGKVVIGERLEIRAITLI